MKFLKTKEVKKFIAKDVQKLNEKQLKTIVGGYREDEICEDPIRDRWVPC
ncbi:bacteriocin [Flavobacterium sp. ASV13]|nr:bacteriocin [Flavobacterium sp. ASV13]